MGRHRGSRSSLHARLVYVTSPRSCRLARELRARLGGAPSRLCAPDVAPNIALGARLASCRESLLEHAVEGDELVADGGDRQRVFDWWGRWRVGGELAEAAFGAFDRVALDVEEAADLDQELDVLAAVEAVAGAGLAGAEDAELRLPVADDVGLHADQLRDLADLEVELVGQ